MNEPINDPTPWLYRGRVGHDVSEGHCSCGGFHRLEDEIKIGTKTVSVMRDGKTGTVEYTEFDSRWIPEPDLPEDFGLIKAVCADGQHRFLPDAPRCGCGAIMNRAVERARLERAVLDAVIEEYKMEYAADHGSNTITRTNALIKMQQAMKAKRETVAALLAFDAE